MRNDVNWPVNDSAAAYRNDSPGPRGGSGFGLQ
jgi:hypothetical protein